MDRRSFIKLTAVTGTSATLASCGNPEHQIIRFVPDEDLTPGIAEIKNSVCPLCSAGCGTTVRVMQADVDTVRDGQAGVVVMSVAKKLEGNPTHPVNHGALCARGQAAIQIAYHPDRIRQPLKRRGAKGSGDFEPISWDAAIAELVAQLDAHPPVCVTRPEANARHDVLALLADHYGQAPIAYELFSDDVLRRANAMSFGRSQLPTFDLANARYVISFGADFLGTWNSPVAHTAAFGRMRQGRPGVRGVLVQAEPRMSLSGASADEWVAVRPGTEGALALGLAHVIMRDKLRSADAAGHAGSLIEGWSKGLADYAPPAAEQKTGVKAARVERLARELAERRPSVAMIGGAPLAQSNGLFQALAVNALNALLGSVNAPGGLTFTPRIGRKPARAAASSLQALAADILARNPSPVPLLLLDRVNPVYTTPPAWRVRDALLKVPFVVSFASFVDDSSVLADLILPDHSFLESWNEARPESGAAAAVATVAGPVMKPLYQTRAMPDVVLEAAKKLKRPVGAAPWTSFDQMLQAQIGEADWATATKEGWVELKGTVETASAADLQTASRTTQPLSRDAAFDGDAAQYPFHFLPFPSQAFHDGSSSHLPWLQEMPDPVSTAMWSAWVEINPQSAGRLGIGDGDVVEIASAHGSVRVPAVITPGIAPDVLAMPVGQGHETFTRYASGRGSNPVKVLAPAVEPETGALAWAATRVKVTRVGGPDGSLIRFAGSLTEAEHTHR